MTRWVLAAAGVLIAAGSPVARAGQPGIDADIQAAFLYNFVKFVEWPPDALAASAPITVCVVGAPALTASLESVFKARPVNGHDLVTVNATSDGPFRSCHVLYHANLDAKTTRRLVEGLAGAAVFTMSDFAKFARLGGVSNLFIENERVRFAVNLDAAKRARLQISSKMLALATLVKDEP